MSDLLENSQMDELNNRKLEHLLQQNGNGATAAVASIPVPTSTPAPAIPDVSEIDRVRDLIFGGQQREIDRRMKNIERRVESLAAEMQDFAAQQRQANTDVENHLLQLEERLRQEVQTLDTRLQTQRRENADRLAALERQISDRLTRLEEHANAQNDALGEAKVDRYDLADLMMEVGLRLRKERHN
jgi:DNA repair exonuclease SbcCD ATPase subunit